MDANSLRNEYETKSRRLDQLLRQRAAGGGWGVDAIEVMELTIRLRNLQWAMDRSETVQLQSLASRILPERSAFQRELEQELEEDLARGGVAPEEEESRRREITAIAATVIELVGVSR